ncbi:hypothetical protein MJO28_008912 [Puccinia striiformis f. sp. tritici]|uniref:Uncharacterized protein n=2 Tax=Puccinia striiformis f. sp. tritici TaxID=168172 RepID=A0A0L0VF92_9BASI|nr:hypothetical protein Pst134EB_016168 [Puccinia striiformis f. sp. tritici]KAI7950091.1 hypothetical protein MJO28_008912 [Puccinia striiformis f. sp. tritici]KNE97664.1 hypothetical protein PSTG_09069 [Puccinia striiformis f. sp. tritici PST-78]
MFASEKNEAPSRSEQRMTKQLQQQGDSIVSGFQKLSETCNAMGIFMPAEEAPPIHETNFKRDLVVQLKSTLLPELRRHIVTLTELLKPESFLKEPGTKLKLISETQIELDRTLDQMFSAIGVLCPGVHQVSFTGINDQHLNELKHYRLYGLHKELTIDFPQVFRHFCDDSISLIHQLTLSAGDSTLDGDDSSSLIHQLTLSTGDFTFDGDDSSSLIHQLPLSTRNSTFKSHDDVDSTRDYILDDVSHCHVSIDSMINWLEGSEFDIVQLAWIHETCAASEMLKILTLLINPIPDPEYSQTPTIHLSKPIIELARILIPVIKLLRLLFDKLSERGMNRKRLPLYTTMNSDQLDSIGKMAEQVGDILQRLKDIFVESSPQPDGLTAQMLTQDVQSLEYLINNPLFLVLVYFLPIVPDTDGFPTQNYLKAWLASWKTLFTIAKNNFVHAARAI